MTHRIGLTVLATVVLLATACGSNTDDTGGSPSGGGTANQEARTAGDAGPIRIGAVLDFTGPFAAASPLFQEGIEAWADTVNEDGGIGGRTVEVLFEDGKADPNFAATAATKLLEQDDVFAIACVLGSSAAVSVVEVAADAGALVLPCAYSDQLFDPVLPNVFVAATPYANQIARGVEVVAEEAGADRAAVVYSSDELGESGLRGARAAFEELGVEEVGAESFDRGAQDLQAQAQNVLRSEPELVVCVCVYSQSGLLAQALSRLGAGDVPIVAPNPTVGPPFFEVASDAASVYAADYVAHDGTDGWDEAAEAMQAAFGRDPNSLELLGLVNVAVLTEAMAQVDGELTTASVTEALESFTDQAIAGLAVPVTFSADRHIASDAAAVYRADPPNRDWVSVADAEAPVSLDL